MMTEQGGDKKRGIRWPKFSYVLGIGSATRVKADLLVDYETYSALRRAQRRDHNELPDMQAVLRYALKLGIEAYLDGQPDERCSDED